MLLWVSLHADPLCFKGSSGPGHRDRVRRRLGV